MIDPIEITIPGKPATKGSMFAFNDRGRIVTKADCAYLKTWTRSVAVLARAARVPLIAKGDPVSVSVVYEFRWPIGSKRPTPCVRPDIDKLARAVLDALTGIAYEDDSQIVYLQAVKAYGPITLTRVLVGRA